MALRTGCSDSGCCRGSLGGPRMGCQTWDKRGRQDRLTLGIARVGAGSSLPCPTLLGEHPIPQEPATAEGWSGVCVPKVPSSGPRTTSPQVAPPSDGALRSPPSHWPARARLPRVKPPLPQGVGHGGHGHCGRIFPSVLCCNLGAAGAICHRIWGAHFSGQSLLEK